MEKGVVNFVHIYWSLSNQFSDTGTIIIPYFIANKLKDKNEKELLEDKY